MPKKCTCNEKRSSGACRNCSQYKLVFMLRHQDRNAANINPVWYSILKEEKKGPNSLFHDYMLPRALKSKWIGRTNVILFYEKGQQQPLYTHKP